MGVRPCPRASRGICGVVSSIYYYVVVKVRLPVAVALRACRRCRPPCLASAEGELADADALRLAYCHLVLEFPTRAFFMRSWASARGPQRTVYRSPTRKSRHMGAPVQSRRFS